MLVVTLMARTRVLVVVVVARFLDPIARIDVSLFVGVLCVLAMHMARLETLVLAPGRTLLAARIVGALLVLHVRCRIGRSRGSGSTSVCCCF